MVDFVSTDAPRVDSRPGVVLALLVAALLMAALSHARVGVVGGAAALRP